MNYRTSCNREILVRKLFKKWYPNHIIYWINNIEDYAHILGHYKNSTKKNFILCQTEESVFCHSYNRLKTARIKLAHSKFWSKDSFIITNSKIDYEKFGKIINMRWLPGLLDLICYRGYDPNLVSISRDEIQYHTAFIYSIPHIGRKSVANFLKNKQDKLSVFRYNDSTFIDTTDALTIFNTSRSAPFVNILKDTAWSNKTAIVLSVENYHHGYARNNPNFAPTLSEKTFKAMHLLRPALVFGGPGTREYLKHFGFDTWDWLIDWSFDYETDYKKSLTKYLLELDRLLKLDIDTITEKLIDNQESLRWNQQKIFKLIREYHKQ